MSSGGPVIAFANVSLSRGGAAVFTGLSLQLSEKRIGLIGNNGSGKSSLLRLVNGLLLPDSGKIALFGLDTRDHRKALPGLAGFLFQNPDHQIVFPTIAEEIAFGLREKGQNAKQARDAAMALLAEHGHADWAGRPIHELSDGQKQLVCILAVTVTSPRLLLLDEPFSSLDLPTRHDLMNRLNTLPQHILMASHDLELLADFDRIIWLEGGTIFADGPPAQVLRAYREACTARTRPLLQAAQ